LAVISLAGIILLYTFTPSPNPFFRLSIATAYIGLGLVGVTLLIGPLNLFRRRPNPVSTDVRRDIGIWAGVIGLAHVVVGLQVHMGGEIAMYFLQQTHHHAWELRSDLFGVGNDVGLIATLILLVLLVTSNDVSLRLFGTGLWKWVQRANYIGVALIVAHGFIYQIVEQRAFPYIVVLAASGGAILATQLAGVLARRHAK
jgi:sulfoxide reductase heme-binding subunit YedZ